ncbi:lysophospholipid acyltransferase family protein [Swingsia samuiensis]|uniref:1-acyl-sn-glycerol-3-phosphate acyltransferase n=1 Tax=Swingsia samuiensis TaxID=1293412 RepID=A0A4Y6UK61_9PROT|nr:lysophospholipid acyltransferase family protein [Swingsia samuiensis]QDH16395.1 1-acyl-sn-glycerol-3-phosphate acyltransferase [Swingsia samuiensis]
MTSLFRGLCFNLYLLILTLTMGLGALPIRLLKNKRWALSYAKLWSKAVLYGFQRICSVQIEVLGQENIPKGPVIIASQHQSFFDGFVWMNLVPLPAYIIKKELTKIPLVGPMLILSGMIPVERSAGSKALRDMIKTTTEAHAQNRQIIIFPEGTRTLPGERHPVQPGIIALARQSNVPIIPVATNSGIFWERNPWRKHSGILKVVIGSPLSSTTSRQGFINNLEKNWETLCKSHNLPFYVVDKSVE